MEELGGYQELALAQRLFGNLVFLAALLFTAGLERLQFQLKAKESSRWWASNGRDVVNAFALFAMWLGLRAVGYTGPIGLAVAAFMLVAVNLLESSLGRYPKLSPAVYLSAAAVVGLPVLVAPRATHAVFRATLEVLF